MSFIIVKDLKAPENQLVYQGPEIHGCAEKSDEQSVFLWAGDAQRSYAAVHLFLSVEEARALAKKLLVAAATVETGVSD